MKNKTLIFLLAVFMISTGFAIKPPERVLRALPSTTLSFQNKADMYAFTPATGQGMRLMGESVAGDQAVRTYWYNGSSTATDDGENVIKPTAINPANPGRYIKVAQEETDGSVSNEGSLTVDAGTSTTSVINSNTSGQTAVTLSAGSGISISESGNTITITNGIGSFTVNNNVSRSLNSNYTISSNTRGALCSYSINATWTVQALLSGSGSAFLEYSIDNGSNWITVNNVGKTLNLLTFAGSDDMNLSGLIPSTATNTRIRTTSSNMTITYTRGQEVLF